MIGPCIISFRRASEFSLLNFFLIAAVGFLSPIQALAKKSIATKTDSPSSDNRVASAFLSQDFINEQLAAHNKSELIKELKITLDEEHQQIFIHGKIQVPVEELRAINLDPQLGVFKFQLTVKPETSRKGFLILEFPLNETYFYPENSKNPKQDRVIVPVQMISLGLASVRGYLSTLSGDFSSFDRRTEKIKALIKALDREIKIEKNSDALDDLKTQREEQRLQLEAIPIERKQLEKLSKHVEHMMGFMGEKELNLNQELGARRNAIILKIKLDQLTPYLAGVELGGVRIVRDKKDGNGESYFAIDINSVLVTALSPKTKSPQSDRKPMKVAPALIMRINQALLESEAIVNVESKEMGTQIKNFKVDLKDDGMHVTGEYQAFMFKIPFDTVVDFVSTDVDTFEARVRELKVAGLDLEFLTKYVLEAIKARFSQTLKGLCTFKYVGEESDHSRALQVKVDSQSLVPAFPDLHLLNVDVRDSEFLLKIGHP
jgi:hypothetical protein